MTIWIVPAKAFMEWLLTLFRFEVQRILYNEVLVKKLILLDRSGGVLNAEKSMEELNNALEEYW